VSHVVACDVLLPYFGCLKPFHLVEGIGQGSKEDLLVTRDERVDV